MTIRDSLNQITMDHHYLLCPFGEYLALQASFIGRTPIQLPGSVRPELPKNTALQEALETFFTLDWISTSPAIIGLGVGPSCVVQKGEIPNQHISARVVLFQMEKPKAPEKQTLRESLNEIKMDHHYLMQQPFGEYLAAAAMLIGRSPVHLPGSVRARLPLNTDLQKAIEEFLSMEGVETNPATIGLGYGPTSAIHKGEAVIQDMGANVVLFSGRQQQPIICDGNQPVVLPPV